VILGSIRRATPSSDRRGRRAELGDRSRASRPPKIFRKLLDSSQQQPDRVSFEHQDLPPRSTLQASSQNLDLAYSFLRLLNINNGILERMSRYEGRLWRQVAQILLLLESFRKGLARTIRDSGY